MADLRPLYSVLPQGKPYVSVHPTVLDDGEKFLDGAITRRREKSNSPPMCLRYGFIMAESQPHDAASEKQVLECSPEVEADVVGGEEDENGDHVFEIYFSQDNRNYLVKLAFGPVEGSVDDDEDSQQEEGGSGSDYYCDDGEETWDEYDDDKETYEDEQSDDEELTGNRVFELYFPGDRFYVVRLVLEKEEGERFLEEEEKFLFSRLQRVAGISYGGEKEEEDEVPTIDNKSSFDLPEVVSEISRKLMEAKIGEPDVMILERLKIDGEKLSRIEYQETAKGSKNEIGARSVAW